MPEIPTVVAENKKKINEVAVGRLQFYTKIFK